MPQTTGDITSCRGFINSSIERRQLCAFESPERLSPDHHLRIETEVALIRARRGHRQSFVGSVFGSGCGFLRASGPLTSMEPESGSFVNRCPFFKGLLIRFHVLLQACRLIPYPLSLIPTLTGIGSQSQNEVPKKGVWYEPTGRGQSTTHRPRRAWDECPRRTPNFPRT